MFRNKWGKSPYYNGLSYKWFKFLVTWQSYKVHSRGAITSKKDFVAEARNNLWDGSEDVWCHKRAYTLSLHTDALRTKIVKW